MATIEQAVRTMLTTGTALSAAGVPDVRVTHGYRLQETALPSVTYSIESKSYADNAGPFYTANLTVNAIAVTSADALDIADAVKATLVSGTYSAINIDAVLVTDEALEPETVGIGDEQEPAMARTIATIYWRT